MKPSLLILAAGMGSRYGGLKQLDEMGPNGETVLDYSIYDALRAGFGEIVFIIRREFETSFREKILSRIPAEISTELCFQELNDLPEGYHPPKKRSKPWGTCHALRAARNIIQSPFAVINADDFYGRDSYQKAVDFLNSLHWPQPTSPASYAMVAFPLENTLSEHGGVNRGITTSKNQLLSHVEEVTDINVQDDGSLSGLSIEGKPLHLSPKALVSMNLWCFTPQIFPQLESEFMKFLSDHGQEEKSECYIPTLVDELIRTSQATCRLIPTESNWFGVTYPDDKPSTVSAIQSLVNKGIYPSPL